MNNLDAIERKLQREKKARQEAEHLLEEKSRQLYQANEKLQKQYQDLQQAQSQLLQSEKMASIGQLAAGVAHEINNPIGFISSNLNSLETYIDDICKMITTYESFLSISNKPSNMINQLIDEAKIVRETIDLDYILEDLKDLINESIEGTDRVRKIVADLRDFSHIDKPDLEELDINHLIEKTINVASNELKYKANVVNNFEKIPTIYGYGGKLNQVFLNLLINAAQSIEHCGTITVSTGHKENIVWIEITDTGKGIPQENLSKIFNPFFTTKEIGKGTGLGLNLSYNIIESHQGNITVQSEVGQGTTFRIELPITGPTEQVIDHLETKETA